LTSSLFDSLDFQFEKIFPDLQILDRTDYKVNITGSDRIYYQRYPYKVGLIDTSVSYSVHRALEMLDWWEMIGREHVKFVSNLTRHYYFKDKKHLDFFIDMFADQIKEVKGPVSEEHVGFLLAVNQNTINYNKRMLVDDHRPVQLVIRNKLWHKEYDLKVEVGMVQHIGGKYIRKHNFHQLPNILKNRELWRSSVKDTCKDIVDKYRDSRWNYFYCDSKHVDDIKMFIKLKHPDARLHISRALVEKNL